MDYSSTGKTVANIHLQQVRVLDPSQQLDQVSDLFIHQGMIAGFSKPAQFDADITLDAKGLWVFPGIIDLCARLREPGQQHKGTIHSESRAAAAGGITHICCLPDTTPVIDTPAVTNLVRERAWQSGYANLLPIGAMTRNLDGETLSEMHALKEAGCIGISQLRRPIKDSKVLMRCLEYAATFDITVFFQSQDYALAKGYAHDGGNATRLGIESIPSSAETIAISRDLLLVEQTGVRAHFGQLSCARSIELIAQAQARGLPVTADVSAHQLAFNENHLDGYNSTHHVTPPYRTEADQAALLDGLRSGVIGMLCSDHQPHEAAAKAAPFAETAAGISALESLLPASFQWVKAEQLNPHTWLQALTHAPAKLLGIDAGNIKIGNEANLVLFNPEAVTELCPDKMLSQGKVNPWLNESLPGQVLLTLCNGHISYRNL